MRKAVLVTGGTGLLGRAFVQGFVDKGWFVVVTTRRPIKDAYELLGNENVLALQVDLEKQDAVKKVLGGLVKAGITPQALVNNARNPEHLKLEEGGSPAQNAWLSEFDLDVRLAHDLARGLIDVGVSRLRQVVNVSSMYGVVTPNPGLYQCPEEHSPIHYSVAKAALIHLTKELAVRLAPSGVRVNAVSFGGVEGRASKEFMARYAKMCPLGRMLRQDEVFGPVEFLVSDASSGVTGHNLVVDGGWSIW